MIGGPLDPENVRKHAPEFTPAGARFVLESCILHGSKLDPDTVLLLREIGKRDRKDWEPRSAETISRERYESRGISLPPKRTKTAEESVEVKEFDVVPEDGPEQTL